MIVELTAIAEADLEAIGDNIARDNPARAVSFGRELHGRGMELADMAEADQVLPGHEHHGIRRRVHGRYLIFYRIGEDRVTILHISGSAVDVDAILFPEG